jgi:uncharacterized protein
MGYVPFAVTSAGFLLLVARRVDLLSWEALGLDRRDVRRGVQVGGVLVAIVLAGYLVAASIPATRDLFLDERVEDLSLAGALFAALVRVPFGTVLLEEVAFRGVLPAALATRMRVWQAVGLSSIAFGVWHVLPAMNLGDTNPVAEGTVGQLPGWITVAGSVVATSVVGVWFWYLRARTRSLLTPMLLHWATNGLGYLFAWWAWNR